MTIALAPQRDDERGRDQELQQRSSQDRQGLAAEREHQVPGLVNGEIETVEPAEGVGGAEADPAVDRERAGERQAPPPFGRTDRAVAQATPPIGLRYTCWVLIRT